MPTLDDLDGLLAQSNVVVFTTFRRDGMPQQSLVTVGKMDRRARLPRRACRNAKAYNLARDRRAARSCSSARTSALSRCSTAHAEVQGPAQHAMRMSLRVRLREVYRIAAEKEHPNWDEYDRVMAEEGRVVVLLRASRITGRNL